MTALNRKQLPPYAKLRRKVDIEKIRQYCLENGYYDYSKFNDMKYADDNHHRAFLLGHQYCKDTYFKELEAPSLQGEMYKQLYFTEIDPNKLSKDTDEIIETSSTIYSRVRRFQKNSANYIPELDEHNYTARTPHAKGVFEDIMNSFNSPVGRVRLAVLMPKFEIKPHVDYDPSYIVRYHIPIITNDQVWFGIKTKEDKVVEFQMPADGSIYFFNSGLLHWVRNDSDEPRLHLIVDTINQSDFDENIFQLAKVDSRVT